jgi:hypothetical protein
MLQNWSVVDGVLFLFVLGAILPKAGPEPIADTISEIWSAALSKQPYYALEMLGTRFKGRHGTIGKGLHGIKACTVR